VSANDNVPIQPVLELINNQSRRVLESYRADPGLVEEHSSNERRIAQGGYGDRQLFELVQNAADELQSDPGGQISVVLTSSALYCANEGSPVTAEGAETILRMSVSRKRGGQIGRFGVGIKSVLAISDTPQFFSKSASALFAFGFDKEWSSKKIRAVVPQAADTPVLRVARVIDVVESLATDSVLAGLMKWATTVVKLPLKVGAGSRLARDIDSFPLEFPLFSPHVGTVTLEDRRQVSTLKREILQANYGIERKLEEYRLDGSTRSTDWRVFTRSHRPSLAATAAAGELHDRPQIDVSWAVPANSGARGAFWAYFPTKFATTLRGILNAPWKTSEDRQAIFDGNAFNDELIRVAAALVVDSLEQLVQQDDPASYIDYLPGRGREAPQFADKRLTDEIWLATSTRRSMVDQNGVLRHPNMLRLHPEGMRSEWLDAWAECPGRPSNWVHRSAEKRERRARVNMIMYAIKREDATVEDWLEALVADRSAVSSAAAIKIAAGMVEAGDVFAEGAVRAQIVLTETGELAAPSLAGLFRRSTDDELPDASTFVHEDVAGQFGLTRALDLLGIHEADAAGRLAEIVANGLLGLSSEQWAGLWGLTRAAGPVQSIEILEKARASLRVRTVSGDLVTASRCLLPGQVVPADGSRDATVAVDPDFHEHDAEILAWLGVTDRPTVRHQEFAGQWFDDYREWAWRSYLATLADTARRPQLARVVLSGPDQVGPLGLFRTLTEEGRAAFIHALPERGITTNWVMQIGQERGTRMTIESPLRWLAKKYGVVDTSQGLCRLVEAVGPELERWGDIFPVAKASPTIAAAFGLPSSEKSVSSAQWRSAVAAAAQSTDDAYPGRVYALLCQASVEWPDDMPTRCRIGSEWSTTTPDQEIAVTANRAEYDQLVRESLPALLVPSEEVARSLIEGWEMQPVSAVVEHEIRYVPESEPVTLTDLFPPLKVYRRDLVRWQVARCTDLERITRTPKGISSEALSHAVQGETVLVTGVGSDLDLLSSIDEALNLELGFSGCESILAQRARQLENERVKATRAAGTAEAKMLALIGEDRLRTGLPPGLEKADAAERGAMPSGERLAKLAIDAYGDSVIRSYSSAVAAQNAEAPRSFAGNTAARKFIAEMGLPEAWAGSKTVSPPDVEEISGPRKYPALHEYQDFVARRMVDHLRREIPGRAMLRLPTGAGKTRVAVEAVVRLVRERSLNGPVLWIAQSDELCEQAVQSWKFVWSSVGPDQQLTVNRFWGGNEATPVVANTQLVVATDAKLAANLSLDEDEWLRQPSMVLVDEAHRAIAPRFTGIFQQLGITRSKTERPLIGLTATPFRGRNEEETRRLVERFGRFRLDDGLFGGEDPYAALQRLRVLASVDHRVLSGSTLRLSDADLESVEKYGVLPSSAEKQLALDSDRNDMLLQEISRIPASWPVLVFATSVSHSKLLTALLNGVGITSTSIDSFTPVSERRNKIEQYRNGVTRVITNYGVLAQGFDAPATKAVVIARPTSSPNVYQQMIGRGLRGPLNGGEDTCLILDVQDNVENYGADLAFTEFEHLWSSQ